MSFFKCALAWPTDTLINDRSYPEFLQCEKDFCAPAFYTKTEKGLYSANVSVVHWIAAVDLLLSNPINLASQNQRKENYVKYIESEVNIQNGDLLKGQSLEFIEAFNFEANFYIASGRCDLSADNKKIERLCRAYNSALGIRI